MMPDVPTSVSLSRPKRRNSSGVRNIKSPSQPLYLVSQRKQYILLEKETCNRQLGFLPVSSVSSPPFRRQTFSSHFRELCAAAVRRGGGRRSGPLFSV
ncbi:hypothetical protein NQZ68_013055 [Xyrichtys novacula]|uniref:Uncharacterized protein n=1 Tax=Xyrichtys novacula TaxID=13765 RepID=A0AAV1FV93_XYRNO|nr:hypothetical protein NQZ68_013055 [Xyrichtys novacula]